MATYQRYVQADFGSAQTGIGTVGYALYLPNGSIVGLRITAGVVERGATGIYGATAVIPSEGWEGEIRWDTGDDNPIYASETIDDQAAFDAADAKTAAEAANVAAGIVSVLVVDGSFTAASLVHTPVSIEFDELDLTQMSAAVVAAMDAESTQFVNIVTSIATLHTEVSKVIGTGAVPLEVFCHISGTPLDGVEIKLTTDEDGEHAAHGPRYSNAFGKFTFNVDPPDPYYAWLNKAGTNVNEGNPQKLVWNGTAYVHD